MHPRALLQEMAEAVSTVSTEGTVSSDFKAIMTASHSMGIHMYAALQGIFSLGEIFNCVAVIAAVYLFVIDRTNWRTNILTALLVPYIALNLPNFIMYYVRSEIGYWVAFIFVVVRLFFPKHFPEHAELPRRFTLARGHCSLLLVSFRFMWVGVFISVLIGLYLLYEHITAAGGFRVALAERGVPMTIGIVCLFIAPAYQICFGSIW